jgi:transposase-like protein
MHMPDRMTGTYDRVEVVTSVQRRRRWTPEEKIRIVEETYLPGSNCSAGGATRDGELSVAKAPPRPA